MNPLLQSVQISLQNATQVGALALSNIKIQAVKLSLINAN